MPRRRKLWPDLPPSATSLHAEAPGLDEQGRVQSPCTGMCSVNSRGMCPGCGRMLAEIAAWTSLSPADQLVVCRLAQARRSAQSERSE